MNRLEEMLNELESHMLVVELVPSKRHDRRDWDMIRCVVDQPPRWYRKICNDHVSSRAVRRGKFDTRVRRANILASLRRMLAGQNGGKYAPDLLAIARRKAA